MRAINRSLLTAAIAVALSNSAHAAGEVLDQNSPAYILGMLCGNGCEWQQEIVSGIGGQLTGITLWDSAPFKFRLGVGDAWHTGPWLVDLDLTPMNGTKLDLASYNIMMPAGTKFVIDLISGPSTAAWTIAGFSPSQYPAGSLWLDGNKANGSMAFKTWVTPVPEPSTYALMILGGGIVALAGRRSKRAHATQTSI